MPSATTAESNDSIAPSMAKAIASGNTSTILAHEIAGIMGCGKLWGIPPKRVPDGLDRHRQQCRRDSGERNGDQHARPGRTEFPHAGDDENRRQRNYHSIQVGRARSAAERLQLGNQFARLLARERDTEQIPDLAGEDNDGDAGGESDRYRMRNVADVGTDTQKSAAIRIAPEMIVASKTPSMPCLFTDAATRIMKAPAGPPIWKRLPAEHRHQKAAEDRGIEVRGPAWCPKPIAIAIDSGNATIATVRPATRSARKPTEL